MACFSSFNVTATTLVLVSLFVFLNMILYARLTYLYSISTTLVSISSNYSIAVTQTNSTHGEGFNHSLQNITHNTSHFDVKPASGHTFLMEKIINQHNFEHIILPTVTCYNRDLELAICVPISSDNQAGRSVIRRTWGSYAKDPNNKAVLLFFVGSENIEVETGSRLARQSSLQEEASIFGDIVQENYIDSYNNLSLKSVSILKWVNSFCPKTKYILKVDDDMYVNIPFLMKVLQQFVLKPQPSAFIFGILLVNGTVIRDPSSKFYTPYNVYPESNYPNFAAGPSYVMSGEAVRLLYQASLRVPQFWLEDVYITGLCARKAQVRVYGSNYFTFQKLLTSGCSFRTMVCAHGYTHDEMVKIHTELLDPNLKC